MFNLGDILGRASFSRCRKHDPISVLGTFQTIQLMTIHASGTYFQTIFFLPILFPFFFFFDTNFLYEKRSPQVFFFPRVDACRKIEEEKEIEKQVSEQFTLVLL